MLQSWRTSRLNIRHRPPLQRHHPLRRQALVSPLVTEHLVQFRAFAFRSRFHFQVTPIQVICSRDHVQSASGKCGLATPFLTRSQRQNRGIPGQAACFSRCHSLFLLQLQISRELSANHCCFQGPVFERVIQEVCDASQVDFEESGVDQKTLLDLREVRDHFPMALGCIPTEYWVMKSGVAAKAGGPKWCGRQCLWGETGF